VTDDVTKCADKSFAAMARTLAKADMTALVPVSVGELARQLEQTNSLQHILKDIGARGDLMRAATGHFSDLKRMGFFGAAAQEQFEQARHLTSVYESQFRLPEVLETIRLAEQMRVADIQAVLDRSKLFPAIANAMQAMHSPWLNTLDELRSLKGFAGLQAVGLSVKTLPGFSDGLASMLRRELGDWRDAVTWPEAVFSDIGTRTDFYLDRGFNPDLTDVPADAFEEGLGIAGLGPRAPGLAELFGGPVPPSDDPAEEEGLHRTNEAHDWLQRFEARLRRFIDEVMTAAFGADWAQRRLPNNLYDQWRAKKLAAEQDGAAVMPLVAYADFTDYERIICKGDNWREVFASSFGRPESVRESLQRLHPIRICAMHARPITQDDQLLLYVEVRRLIGIMRSPR
jgi:hypothetical protein